MMDGFEHISSVLANKVIPGLVAKVEGKAEMTSRDELAKERIREESLRFARRESEFVEEDAIANVKFHKV